MKLNLSESRNTALPLSLREEIKKLKRKKKKIR